jgi:hypothetical protein
MDDEAVIIVCQGPPRCDLAGDAAIAAQEAGCVWCDRCYITEAGERWEGPGNA